MATNDKFQCEVILAFGMHFFKVSTLDKHASVSVRIESSTPTEEEKAEAIKLFSAKLAENNKKLA